MKQEKAKIGSEEVLDPSPSYLLRNWTPSHDRFLTKELARVRSEYLSSGKLFHREIIRIGDYEVMCTLRPSFRYPGHLLHVLRFRVIQIVQSCYRWLREQF